MPRCLFCLRDSDRLTNEHVFPAALGGDIVVADSVCAEENNGLSRQFEQRFAVELAPLRNLLVIRDRYRKLPNVPAKAELDGKALDARLLGDGTVRLTPVVTVVTRNGVREILFEHMTDKQRDEKRREAEEKGHTFIETEPTAAPQAQVLVPGTLSLIGAPEGLRTATKIAYVGFASGMGCEFAIRNTSEIVREYVRSGGGEAPAKLFLNNEYLSACAQGPHQHSIVIAGQKESHHIDAIVRLFGVLSYLVTLTDRYEGADFCQTLVYDAQRKRTDPVLFGSFQSEILQIRHVTTSSETIWDDPIASGISLIGFLEREFRRRISGPRQGEPL